MLFVLWMILPQTQVRTSTTVRVIYFELPGRYDEGAHGLTLSRTKNVLGLYLHLPSDCRTISYEARKGD